MAKEKVKIPIYKRVWFTVPALFIGMILLVNLLTISEDESNASKEEKETICVIVTVNQ